jgi:hypothetical protein
MPAEGSPAEVTLVVHSVAAITAEVRLTAAAADSLGAVAATAVARGACRRRCADLARPTPGPQRVTEFATPRGHGRTVRRRRHGGKIRKSGPDRTQRGGLSCGHCGWRMAFLRRCSLRFCACLQCILQRRAVWIQQLRLPWRLCGTRILGIPRFRMLRLGPRFWLGMGVGVGTLGSLLDLALVLVQPLGLRRDSGVHLSESVTGEFEIQRSLLRITRLSTRRVLPTYAATAMSAPLEISSTGSSVSGSTISK